MTSHVVSAGVTSTSLTLHSGDTETVLSGGIASATTISAGGVEYISSGGQGCYDVVLGGGLDVVSSGGTESGMVVSSGGRLTGAGTLSGVTSVYGLLSGLTVDDSDPTVTGLVVGSGGSAKTVTVTQTMAEIASGGTASALTAISATVLVDVGATTTGTILGAGDPSEFDRGSAVGTVVGSGASEFVYDGAVALGARVANGGQMTVIAGGDATRATISSGGSQTISSGGLASATRILNGAVEYISSGGVSSDAVVSAGGAEYLLSGAVASGIAVTSSGYVSVSSSATLLLGPTGGAENLGMVTVASGGYLEMSGTIDNAGEMSVSSDAHVLFGASTTLTGSGQINLVDFSFTFLSGMAAGARLDNEDNLIDGAGFIYLTTLINGGTIDATGVRETLIVDAASGVNTGLMEATGLPNSQGLVVGGHFENSGGVIAANGGVVYLTGDISGGAIESRLGGLVNADDGEVDGTASAVDLDANIVVNDDTSLTLDGAIDNTGSILLSGVTSGATLSFASPVVTLTGGGVIEMTAVNGNEIVGKSASDELVNEDNTIEGVGTIGSGSLTLVNNGTIDATERSLLIVDPTSLINTGLIEATAGDLVLQSDIQNSGGVIAANGGDVELLDGVISGGSLKAGSDNDLLDDALTAVTLDGVAAPVTIAATIFDDSGATLGLAGAIVNDGVLSFDESFLLVSGAMTTLTGSGKIELSDDFNQISGTGPADVFDNETNTIEGGGYIGAASLTLINRGVIDATGIAEALVVDPVSATNTGLMEATALEGLFIECHVTNAGGVVAANGGDVHITSGGLVSGGVISGDGTDELVVSSAASLAGAQLASGALVQLLSGGVVSGATVGAGGVLQGPGSLHGAVVDAGLVSGAAVVSGGSLTISSGGVASATRVTSGGLEYVRASGTAEALLVSSGGKVVVSSGGLGSGTKVLNGGVEDVMASGTTTGTVVSSGGKQIVSSGGLASGARVLSGGQEYVYSGGRATGATISSGGAETISSGGVASGLALLSGGVLIDEGEVRIVGAGKLAGTVSGSGSIVEAGGGDVLLSGSGAAFGGRAVISGGTLELATAGALGTGSVDFVEPATGSAVLQIDAGDAPTAGGTFANVISNFSGANEDIDLRSIAFVAGASATVSGGVLTLSDDGKTYKFDLAGSIAGAYPVLSDGHGGTLIDPKAIAFTHAAAAFAPSHAAIAALVSSTSPTSRTPFAYATASAGAGH
jgi:autotransporter passenger strand-loop-strand repeat protein